MYMCARDVGSGAWSEAQKLLASDGSQYDMFGISVALDGEVLVVGASSDDNAGGSNAGAVYVFVRDAGSCAWSEAQQLLASDGSGYVAPDTLDHDARHSRCLEGVTPLKRRFGRSHGQNCLALEWRSFGW